MVILNYFENIEKENIWTIVIALIVFVIFVQFVLIIPSLLNIRKRVNEKQKN
ncbi:hypothetical protein P700755_000749 [Psychroflexus torquis ATCC 700755]|uniref:Uncharacterized protein n=2 Tax=Psychroflexus TaxID=83612 RepID=K4ICZ8_PSYTT|nr:hypothetical protein P700755_000749 [Psychroflexus torquis ATCC 700755]